MPAQNNKTIAIIGLSPIGRRSSSRTRTKFWDVRLIHMRPMCKRSCRSSCGITKTMWLAGRFGRMLGLFWVRWKHWLG